ncbi:MAG: DUF167 domain-containing protein [Bacteriovoracaceae bacterium]
MKDSLTLEKQITQVLYDFIPHVKIKVHDTSSFSLIIDMKIKPQAKQENCRLIPDKGIMVQLLAPPVDGEANAGLITFFAKGFGLAKKQVILVRGQKSRQKTLEIIFELKAQKNLSYFIEKIKKTIIVG